MYEHEDVGIAVQHVQMWAYLHVQHEDVGISSCYNMKMWAYVMYNMKMWAYLHVQHEDVGISSCRT